MSYQQVTPKNLKRSISLPATPMPSSTTTENLETRVKSATPYSRTSGLIMPPDSLSLTMRLSENNLLNSMVDDSEAAILDGLNSNAWNTAPLDNFQAQKPHVEHSIPHHPNNSYMAPPHASGSLLFSNAYATFPADNQWRNCHFMEPPRIPSTLGYQNFHNISQEDAHAVFPYGNLYYPYGYGNYFTAPPTVDTFHIHSFGLYPPRPQPHFHISCGNPPMNTLYHLTPLQKFPPSHMLRETEDQFRVASRPSTVSSSSAPSSSNSTSETSPTSGNARLSSQNNILLKEFKHNREKDWVIGDILGHVADFSGDQQGSRLIQKQLENASYEERNAVFREIFPDNIHKLMRHIFGNYVIQKLFDYGSKQQINALFGVIELQVEVLSLDMYGCRVVQKALEVISPEQQSSVIQSLVDSSILLFAEDVHASHVVQKCIEVVAPERLIFLLTICDNILGLTTHPFGCRVIQTCLDILPTEYTRSLLHAIHIHSIDLMKDQYGNYVIQGILQGGHDLEKAHILAAIRGNIVKLSQHKYASNVCEKALMCADSESRAVLIEEIMTAKSRVSGIDPIIIMVKDRYANYVLQRALTLAEGQQRSAFFVLVQSVVVQLRALSRTYSSRALVSLERLLAKHFDQPAP